MKYVNENIVLNKDEMKLLSSLTWNDSIEPQYDALEFVENMIANILWATSEIDRIKMVEQDERKRILVEILQLAIKHFDRFKMLAHESARAAGASLDCATSFL